MPALEPPVLVLLPYYFPGYKAGEPIRSIINITAALGSGFHFKIITSDRDLGDHKPYDNIVPYFWRVIENAEVAYIPRGAASIWWLIRELRKTAFDVLYLSSLFSRKLSMLPCFVGWIGFPPFPA